ncbi:MAG TPA: glycosyltransferase [Thermoanaerobaculia bacterium]|nr:glycosyltransferase [Thermoanaerobaculia bacterium]
MIPRGLRVAARVLRAEGARAVRERTLDRLAEARRRRSFLPSDTPLPSPVLDVASAAPAVRLGGVQAQLLHRLEAEARLRPVALLYPDGKGYRLEVQAGGERRALQLPGEGAPSSPALEDIGWERAVARATRLVGATVLHIEGLADIPLGSLLELGRRGLRLVISLHDFSPFCPRPHLLERPPLRFCDYSRDLDRCARCLRWDWPLDGAWQARRRALAGALLAGAEAVVYPSDFLRRTYLDLFPGLPAERQRVIPPAAAWRPVRPRVPTGQVRHVALVGGAQVHKGGLVFEEVARRLGDRSLRWSVYGGGDAEILARLRELPRVDVRGYYRSGSLPSLLRRDRVDVALLLSIVPESYSLVLSECWAAGVPVTAFDLGAVGDRIREGGGWRVPLEAGVEGVVDLLRDLLDGKVPLPQPLYRTTLAAADVAREWQGLYRALTPIPHRR